MKNFIKTLVLALILVLFNSSFVNATGITHCYHGDLRNANPYFEDLYAVVTNGMCPEPVHSEIASFYPELIKVPIVAISTPAQINPDAPQAVHSALITVANELLSIIPLFPPSPPYTIKTHRAGDPNCVVNAVNPFQ